MSDAVSELIRERTGLDLGTLGAAHVATRLREQRDSLGARDPDQHARALREDRTAFDRLIATLVVHETWFYRYPTSFVVLAESAVARWRTDPRVPFRVMSLACSTGEEAYSIYIALREAGLPDQAIQIEACDVSADAVARARAGLYGPRSVRELTPQVLERWFEIEGGGRRRVRGEVRRGVEFRVANLAELTVGTAPRAYDAVFCRNVLIYLVPEARTRLLSWVERVLRPDGMLFLGHAELGAVSSAGWTAVPGIKGFAVRRAGGGAGAAVRGSARRSAAGSGTAGANAPAPAPLPVPPRPAEAPRRLAVDPAPSDPPMPPRPSVSAVEEARRLADLGDLAGAGRLLSAEREAGRISADLFCAAATLHSAAGRDEEVEADLTRALYLDPEHYDALVHLALVVEARGDRARGLRLRERAAARRARDLEEAGGEHVSR